LPWRNVPTWADVYECERRIETGLRVRPGGVPNVIRSVPDHITRRGGASAATDLINS
jgi:hypothetical protein